MLQVLVQYLLTRGASSDNSAAAAADSAYGSSPHINASVLEVLILACSSVSLIACVTIFVMFVRTPSVMRSLAMRLVLMLCVSDTLMCASIVPAIIAAMADPKFQIGAYGAACNAQAVMQNEGYISMILNTWLISFTIYQLVIHPQKIPSKYLHPDYFWAISFGSAFVMSVIPIFLYDYAPETPLQQWNCYLEIQTNNAEAIALRVIYEILPFFALLAYQIFVVVRIVRKYQAHAVTQQMRTQIGLLVAYPTILTLCWLPDIVRRIVEIFNTDVLEEMAYFDQPLLYLNGLVNSIVYGCGLVQRRTDAASRATESVNDSSQDAGSGMTSYHYFPEDGNTKSSYPGASSRNNRLTSDAFGGLQQDVNANASDTPGVLIAVRSQNSNAQSPLGPKRSQGVIQNGVSVISYENSVIDNSSRKY